jgi:DNA-binding CsgD family transcriptional regulator
MARLTHNQSRKLLECLGELYALNDLDSFTRHALVVASQVIRADYTPITEMNLRRKRLVAFANPENVDLSAPPELHALLFREHPLVKYLRENGDVPALRLSDFLSRRQYRETALYREAYRRLGVEHQLGCTLPSPTPQRSVALAFIRGRKDFSAQEKVALNLLRPHLFQAYRNAEVITDLREASGQARLALEAAGRGLVALNERGRVRFCTPRARQWLATWFGLAPCRNGCLPGELRRWLRQQQPPSPQNGRWPASRQSLVLVRNGSRLTIRLLDGTAPGWQTLVLEERRTELSAAAFKSLGLTMREAEVLLWVAQGKTNPEIGTILGVSPGTVHKHTEHILQKLGVETRTAAAARAWECLTEGQYGESDFQNCGESWSDCAIKISEGC